MVVDLGPAHVSQEWARVEDRSFLASSHAINLGREAKPIPKRALSLG
jgi:hypothetical protein